MQRDFEGDFQGSSQGDGERDDEPDGEADGQPCGLGALLRGLGVGLAILLLMAAVLIAAMVLAGTARADPDTVFADQLHGYGIYGQKDYNAWIAKITCTRLRNGTDADAEHAAQFVRGNLARETDTGQVWEFLSAAITTYCPDELPVILSVAEKG